MKKNDKFIGVCTDYTYEGKGIVKIDNFPFFVDNILVGEEAELLVLNTKKTYGYAKVMKITKPSQSRVIPKCSVYNKCGGCSLQHMSYDEQLNFKRNHVKGCFERIAKIDVEVNECLGMDNPWMYRNKVQVPVRLIDDTVKVGFYRKHSNDIVEFDNCEVQSDLQNKIVKYAKERIVHYDLGECFKHVLVKHAFSTDEVMVVLIVNENNDKISKLSNDLSKEFTNIKSIILNINTRNDNVILGEKEILLYGKDSIQDILNGLTFNISSKSFYQINSKQTEVLYSKAIELASINSNDTVIDLYCGTGTIGMFVSKYAKKVIGIEIVPEAVENAKENAKVNEIDNIEFICGDAKEVSKSLLDSGENIDVIIVDPPRKGLDENTIDTTVKMKPKRIVYISCDPSTLARDCSRYKELGYNIQSVQPVDMFPQTYHIENVVLLELDK